MAEMNRRLKNNEHSAHATHHIGLFNVNTRIRYLLGEDCGVELFTNEQGGVTCCLTLTRSEAYPPQPLY